ncbi:MAG: hypothetical protein M3Y59_18390 [Myxococcota bacterium]|nr:hypothetical protein [Myxococcota bacterium]
MTDVRPVAVFLHSGDYDRMHQGLSIAVAAASLGRHTDLFLFWWALERLIRGALDEPDFPEQHADTQRRFETRGMPTLRQLLQAARESGLCTIYACSGSLTAVAATPEAVRASVDQVVGWTTILKLTANVTDRYYL